MQEDGRLVAYLKTQLSIASWQINELLERLEKTTGKPKGADGVLVAHIRSKQLEWADCMRLKELPVQGQPPLHPLLDYAALRSDILLGRRYAASETHAEALVGPKYAPQLGPFTPKPEPVRSAPLKALSPHAPEFVSKTSKQVPEVESASERLQEDEGAPNGGEDLQREEERLSAEGRSASNREGEMEDEGEQAADPEEEGPVQGVSEKVEDIGEPRASKQDLEDSIEASEAQPRLATPPGFESARDGHLKMEEENAVGGEGSPSEQRERRRQRLERKRRKENEASGEQGDGLPGSKAMFGSRQTWTEPAGKEEIGGGDCDELGAENMQEVYCAEENESRPQTGETSLSGVEVERPEGELPAGGYDSEGFPRAALGTPGDFPALSGGSQQADKIAPSQQQSSTWAKHLSTRAESKEGSARQAVERLDEAYLDYMQKKQAFEDEDRRRRRRMRSKTDFECMERFKGRMVNSVQGLQLHEQFLDPQEQEKAIAMIKELERMGHCGELRGRTFSAPKKWMKGKGRVTIQFGCCYNYAVDKQGRPPGILQDEGVEPMPVFLEDILDRMVRWGVMPGGRRRPDSAIINLYSEGDCIPIHIDHHDFDRPFCTMSLLSVANIKFGAVMESLDAGQFTGAFELPLPTGSVCILNGNAADVAKHCIPSVPQPRISVTFRRMKPEKAPYTNAVLPLPDYAVFRSHAFPPSLLPPISPPLPTFPGKSAPPSRSQTPPLDNSLEAWPDLSGSGPGASKASSSRDWRARGSAWRELGMETTSRPSSRNREALPPRYASPSRPLSSLEARAMGHNRSESTPPDSSMQRTAESSEAEGSERPRSGHRANGQRTYNPICSNFQETVSSEEEANPLLTRQTGRDAQLGEARSKGANGHSDTAEKMHSGSEQAGQVARSERWSDMDDPSNNPPWRNPSEEQALLPRPVQRERFGNGRFQSPNREGVNGPDWRSPASNGSAWRRGNDSTNVAQDYPNFSDDKKTRRRSFEGKKNRRRSGQFDEQRFSQSPEPQARRSDQERSAFSNGRARFENQSSSEGHEAWNHRPNSHSNGSKGPLYSEQNGDFGPNGKTSHEPPPGFRILTRTHSGPGEYLHQLGMETLPDHSRFEDDYYHAGNRSSSGSEIYDQGEHVPLFPQAAQTEKIPVVDASCVFNESVLSPGKVDNGSEVVTSSAAVVASPSLAMFFPQEAPKKDLQI